MYLQVPTSTRTITPGGGGGGGGGRGKERTKDKKEERGSVRVTLRRHNNNPVAVAVARKTKQHHTASSAVFRIFIRSPHGTQFHSACAANYMALSSIPTTRLGAKSIQAKKYLNVGVRGGEYRVVVVGGWGVGGGSEGGGKRGGGGGGGGQRFKEVGWKAVRRGALGCKSRCQRFHVPTGR